MSMMVSFVLSFFPRDVLDEILKLIESVSEDFPSYSLIEVRQEVSNLDSSVVVHELELAINRDLNGCLCSFGSQ